MAKLKRPENAAEARNRGTLRFDAGELVQVAHKDYLMGLAPSRNAYLHLCFDRAHPSRSFCGIFAPALGEAWVCFGGLDSVDGEAMRSELEQNLAEQLSQIGGSSPYVRTEASFVSGKSLTALLQWAERRLQELRRRDGGSVCVLCSPLTTGEMRGLAAQLLGGSAAAAALHRPEGHADMQSSVQRERCAFPCARLAALDQPPLRQQVAAALRVVALALGLVQGGGPPDLQRPRATARGRAGGLGRALRPAAAEGLATQVVEPEQPAYLGETSLTLVDGQEGSVAAMNFILAGKDLTAGRGGGQINKPGVYRSICLEINLRTKLCICALQHARFLSDREGGELAKKMVKKNVGDVLKSIDHTSEVSLGCFESLVNMVQEIASTCEAKEKDILALRTVWSAQSVAAKAAVREAGLRLDVLGTGAEDALLVETLAGIGHADAQLASKLEDLRAEHDANSKLLDGLYGWLASETSLLHDPALLRKVHQYMDRVLQMFMGMLKKSGCSVIHASYQKVIFATGKYTVLPDVQIFWESLSANLQGVKVLEPLALTDESSLAELYYGVLWMDPANWSAVPIDGSTGEIVWKARSHWKIGDFLPPAVRPSLVLYASDLLVGPQRELGKRHNKPPAAAAEGSDAAADMDVDEGAAPPPPAPAAPPAAAASTAGGAGSMSGDAAMDGSAAEAKVDGAAKKTEDLDEVREFIQGPFFSDLRRRVLHYMEVMQMQQQRELPGNFGDSKQTFEADEDFGDSSEDEQHGTQDRQLRKAERLRRHLEAKWSFPEIPGRRAVPGSIEMEFMRALIQIFQLEETLADQVVALRERMCQKLRLSAFGVAANVFENPCFPLVLRDVVCPWCHTASHVDVTSHASRGPGLWTCTNCERFYEKDVMQGMLVALLENVVQAWQAAGGLLQEVQGLQELPHPDVLRLLRSLPGPLQRERFPHGRDSVAVVGRSPRPALARPDARALRPHASLRA
eukprot:CAMPEP_0204203814 /NCGR_PEP_ID=MMETSP0361-20130328/69199_1 /ASSEMBLY_ACC=CAM_ASM_000343 /TAXON_ID=268821 /ORGANISM="Scrippsiella Hangoei, Strain SHTV-5" /LENGTH=970 /DNA_ID=CAMNT_0051166833 /DNA_START=29 /DNA_END=2936 /DNA_ORIENTATION=-